MHHLQRAQCLRVCIANCHGGIYGCQHGLLVVLVDKNCLARASSVSGLSMHKSWLDFGKASMQRFYGSTQQGFSTDLMLLQVVCAWTHLLPRRRKVISRALPGGQDTDIGASFCCLLKPLALSKSFASGCSILRLPDAPYCSLSKPFSYHNMCQMYILQLTSPAVQICPKVDLTTAMRGCPAPGLGNWHHWICNRVR